MPDVGDIMTVGCACVSEHDSIRSAADQMQRLGVGALPICNVDNELIGILTDRDIVLQIVAARLDPATTAAGRLAYGMPVYARADQPIEEAIDLMRRHKIRRLPVVDGNDTLVGIVSLGDVATAVDVRRSGTLLRQISSGCDERQADAAAAGAARGARH
jgi:CBS domain-containing protein